MSSKTSAQQGRRTPLSLSGAVTKSQPNKVSNNIANGGGINANGHPASSNNKQDNKLQQQKVDQPSVSNVEAKENPSKKQPLQAERKSQQNDSKKPNEKSQNGASSSNKNEATENKQQQQNKEKAQHQNGNDENKVTEKEKNEKSDKSEKQKEKPEKDITKSKEDKKKEQNVPQNKKDEKKAKEVPKDTKEDKKEVCSKSDANSDQQQETKCNDTKSKDEDKEKVKSAEKKSEKKEEIVDIVEDQVTQKSNPATPKSISKANKTPVSKTPTKMGEKTPQKPPTINAVRTIPVYKREETTTIDDNDIEMEPFAIENSPVKSTQPVEAANINIVPAATSTPGKTLLSKRSSGFPKSEVQLAIQTEVSPDRPRMFSQISGRKSIRPISEYTPSKFQSNLQFRESYRRINTELDVTNTSMNVTVGSEAPSNFSFSLFGRGRKRDRTPPPQLSQSAIGELQTDIETSPPKKARLDIHGLFSAVSSPMSLLRNRFSKASLQSSTPVKLQQKPNTAEDEIEVQNVSGISEHEEITTPAEINLVIEDNNATLGEEAKETKLKANAALHSEAKEFKEVSYEKVVGAEESFEQSDIKTIETPLQSAAGDPMAKNKRCVVM